MKLNPKLFDADVEMKPTRAGFGEGLVKLGEKDPQIVALCADLTESTYNHLFAEKFPERFFEMGVAEQNMAAVAAGLAVSGKTAFISSYATFSPGKNWETIRTTIVYNRANVKIAGHHSGIMTGPDGATHQATEDIALMRCLPGVDIFIPCDAIEAEKATRYAGSTINPTYLRFTRDKTPQITTEETPFEPGRVQEYWQPKSDEQVVTIFATGYMLFYALLAAKELEDKGRNIRVINVSTIKPLDTDMIISYAKKSISFVSVEDHQIMGGLGSAIAEILVQHAPIPMRFIGLKDRFAESGDVKSLLAKYGMDEIAIREVVNSLYE